MVYPRSHRSRPKRDGEIDISEFMCLCYFLVHVSCLFETNQLIYVLFFYSVDNIFLFVLVLNV